jgi:hypothetical protein
MRWNVSIRLHSYIATLQISCTMLFFALMGLLSPVSLLISKRSRISQATRYYNLETGLSDPLKPF